LAFRRRQSTQVRACYSRKAEPNMPRSKTIQ
jgi:hypothetical protein